MKNSSIIKMSVLSSLAGITLLYVGAARMRPGLTPISQIDNDFVGLKAQISGQVVNITSHPEGHIFLKLKDESGGVISVPIFERVNSKLSEEIELLDNVQVTGEVKDYQGELELFPEEAESIQVIHTAPVGLSKVDNSRIGETIKIRGVISKKTSFNNGSLLLNVRKNEDRLPAYIPAKVWESENLPELEEGDTIEIGGKVQEYEGKLELVLGDSYNLDVVEGTR